jgi:radical SAM protein with 4Fe4S-binding SPASM domain
MTKCLIPWSNIDIDAEGNIAPCCKFKFEGQTRQNITSDKINDYVDSDFLKDIKKEMNANIWPKGCVRCKTEEENKYKK